MLTRSAIAKARKLEGNVPHDPRYPPLPPRRERETRKPPAIVPIYDDIFVDGANAIEALR